MNIEKIKEKINQKNAEWQELKPLLELNNSIDSEKYNLIKSKKAKRSPSFSKTFLIFLFINFTALELFTGWVTVESFKLAMINMGSPDFSPLITLIGAVIGETLSYGIYCAKSKAENTEGGVVYATALRDQDQCE